ncbi:MAG: DUF262 domain-containing protein [Chloroflexi bacterium]|nr:DUF262 domain-containing protein [Chloroflexota bacterium]
MMTDDGQLTAQADAGSEEIEGLGYDQPGSWGDYPIDTLLIRHEPRTVHDVLRRIEQGRFVMDPDFQREFIWDDDKQSKLIESVMMRIPLPVFYLAEDPQGRMVVVDGLQRLSTFHRFVNNELRLRLSERPELDGKRFCDLPHRIQNRVEDCNLILYILDAKVPDQTRLDIFERVNGGVPLTRQQMRNCLYMGDATRFLRKESRTDLFKRATGGSLRWQTMRDREFVNRFCAFQILDLDEYRDMDEFLARCLTKMNKQVDVLPILSRQFELTLGNNLHLFGKHAFRKHAPDQEHRSVINASIWDVMSTGLSRYSQQSVEEHSERLQAEFYRLLQDEDFMNAITYGTSDAKRVHRRFEMSNAMLEDVLGAYAA